MDDKDKLFEGGGYLVTATTLQTPRRTYKLENIEFISVRQPLFLLTLVVSIGLLAFAFRFWPYLYQDERIIVIAGTVLATLISYQFGTLRIHSLSFRDSDLGSLIGRTATLNGVRRAVEQSMSMHKSKEGKE